MWKSQNLLSANATSRRQFLAYNAALVSIPFLGQTAQAGEKPRFSENPFSLGVASGDPDHRGVVLWTRLAPQPLQPDGGMPPTALRVGWVVAEDENLRR